MTLRLRPKHSQALQPSMRGCFAPTAVWHNHPLNMQDHVEKEKPEFELRRWATKDAKKKKWKCEFC